LKMRQEHNKIEIARKYLTASRISSSIELAVFPLECAYLFVKGRKDV
jgi:hypothetical protein